MPKSQKQLVCESDNKLISKGDFYYYKILGYKKRSFCSFLCFALYAENHHRKAKELVRIRKRVFRICDCCGNGAFGFDRFCLNC